MVDEPLQRVNSGRRAALAIGRSLCSSAVLFASGDVWPVLHVGFTFRLAQICIISAAIFLIAIRDFRIRAFPGIAWIYAFCVWIAVTLPASLYLERSVAYVVWAVADAMIVLIFVQCFREKAEVLNLFRWALISYIILSLFGLLQFLLYWHGIDLFVREWWLKGRIARINGLSYEPSYYATYLIPGWVSSAYLVERRAEFPSQRLQWLCFVTTTFALILCSSRMGYLMMALWSLFRGALLPLRAVIRGVVKRGRLRAGIGGISAILIMIIGAVRYRSRLLVLIVALPFLFSGLGILGHSSQSAGTRLQSLARTWRAFMQHPIIGTGIGALPADIAAQTGQGVYSIREAKKFEGMSIAAEILASTGIVGAAIVVGLVLTILGAYRRSRERVKTWQRLVLSAQGWGLLWMLLMLQMNQNFLRIYIFVDLAILICTILLPASEHPQDIDASHVLSSAVSESR